MPWAQVLLEHLEGWVHSVPREPLALEELAVQPALRVRPVLQKRPGCGWCLGWRKWGRR